MIRVPGGRLSVFVSAFVLAATLLGAPPPAADAAASVARQTLTGANRFDTARVVSATIGVTPTVVLARGDVFADALAGAYVAGRNNAAILLSLSDSLPPETDAALTAARATKVIVMGGPAAIGDGVVASLLARGLVVERLQGPTRFETAQLAAQSAGSTVVGTLDGLRTAIVVSGLDFPDAVSAAPVSFAAGFPVLLTGPDAIHDATRAALGTLGIQQVVIVGGPLAVGEGVEAELRAAPLGLAVTRLAGANRSATSVEVANFAIAKLGFTNRRFGLARSDDFADALVYAPLAGRSRPAPARTGVASAAANDNGASPTILTNPSALDLAAEQLCRAVAPTTTQFEVVTGPDSQLPTAAASCLQLLQSGGALPGGAPLILAPLAISPTGPTVLQNSLPGATSGTPGRASFALVGASSVTDAALISCFTVNDTGATPVFVNANGGSIADGTALGDPAVGTQDRAHTPALLLRPTEALDPRVVAEIARLGTDYLNSLGDVSSLIVDNPSDASGCVRPVIFDDVNNDNALNVDSAGRPIERIALGGPINYAGRITDPGPPPFPGPSFTGGPFTTASTSVLFTANRTINVTSVAFADFIDGCAGCTITGFGASTGFAPAFTGTVGLFLTGPVVVGDTITLRAGSILDSSGIAGPAADVVLRATASPPVILSSVAAIGSSTVTLNFNEPVCGSLAANATDISVTSTNVDIIGPPTAHTIVATSLPVCGGITPPSGTVTITLGQPVPVGTSFVTTTLTPDGPGELQSGIGLNAASPTSSQFFFVGLD